jgi:hypothetical protein
MKGVVLLLMAFYIMGIGLFFVYNNFKNSELPKIEVNLDTVNLRNKYSDAWNSGYRACLYDQGLKMMSNRDIARMDSLGLTIDFILWRKKYYGQKNGTRTAAGN